MVQASDGITCVLPAIAATGTGNGLTLRTSGCQAGEAIVGNTFQRCVTRCPPGQAHSAGNPPTCITCTRDQLVSKDGLSCLSGDVCPQGQLVGCSSEISGSTTCTGGARNTCI